MSEYPKIHLSIAVSDLERSIDFYTRFFGDEPVKIKEGYAKFLPAIAPLNLALELEPKTEPRKGLLEHMGIQVDNKETVMSHLARIKGAGLSVKEQMGVDCCHANQDKFWVEDPDGTHWEIYVLNYDLEEAESSTTCCQEEAVLAVEESTEACCEPTCCS